MGVTAEFERFAEMLERVDAFFWAIADWLLGWTLFLPSDGALFAVALLSAMCFVLIRRLTTNQELLRRCHLDKQQLRVLRKEAKVRGDKSASRRLRAIKSMVALKQFKAEGKPLIAALLPIALLAGWSARRLDFHPPRAGEPLVLSAYFPVSASGEVVHLAPEPAVRARTGWIQEVAPLNSDGRSFGKASWTLDPQRNLHLLQIRFRDRTYAKPVRVGERTYEPPSTRFDDRLLNASVELKPVKLFGSVPGVSWIRPWMAGYLILTLPLGWILKRLMKVY
jgi:uncharacterized membrane protein (DUF106 family)